MSHYEQLLPVGNRAEHVTFRPGFGWKYIEDFAAEHSLTISTAAKRLCVMGACEVPRSLYPFVVRYGAARYGARDGFMHACRDVVQVRANVLSQLGKALEAVELEQLMAQGARRWGPKE